MDLRKATLLLILGLAYTLVHKAALGLFPALSTSRLATAVTGWAWLVATATLPLFAYQFLRELRPERKDLRVSLLAIIVLTTLVIVSRLPLWAPAGPSNGPRILFRAASLLNAFAFLLFTTSLLRALSSSSPLQASLRTLCVALGLTATLGLVGSGYVSYYLLTGIPREPGPLLPVMAVLSFLLTYGASLWFLILLWRMPTYSDLLPNDVHRVAA